MQTEVKHAKIWEISISVKCVQISWHGLEECYTTYQGIRHRISKEQKVATTSQKDFGIAPSIPGLIASWLRPLGLNNPVEKIFNKCCLPSVVSLCTKLILSNLGYGDSLTPYHVVASSALLDCCWKLDVQTGCGCGRTSDDRVSCQLCTSSSSSALCREQD